MSANGLVFFRHRELSATSGRTFGLKDIPREKAIIIIKKQYLNRVKGRGRQFIV